MNPVSEPIWPLDPIERAALAAAIGLRRPAPPSAAGSLEALAAADPDPRVRSVALGALVRLVGPGALVAWQQALGDPARGVRRRACEVSPLVRPRRCEQLVEALSDSDPGVVEAAAWALGELGAAALRAGAVEPLGVVAKEHADTTVREAAVASLGSLGDAAGLPAVLSGCTDRPAVRRRSVVALASFEGPEVEAALGRALGDRDWQVRQTAEDVLGLADEAPSPQDPVPY